MSASTDGVDSLVFVYVLSGALAFTSLLVVLLSVLMYKIIKRNNCQSTGNWNFFVSVSICSLNLAFQ